MRLRLGYIDVELGEEVGYFSLFETSFITSSLWVVSPLFTASLEELFGDRLYGCLFHPHLLIFIALVAVRRVDLVATDCRSFAHPVRPFLS